MAEQAASVAVSDTTQISAAAHAVVLALLKLNRLIPKAFLSLHGRYSRWRAYTQKQPIERCINRTTAFIEMNNALLTVNDNQEYVELPVTLVNRMHTQRRETSQRQCLPTDRRGLNSRQTPAGNHQSDPGQVASDPSAGDQSAGQDQSGSLQVTKLELQILNKEHEAFKSELKDRLHAIDRQQHRLRKTYIIPTEIFCLIVGLVFWCSLVIGLILGLGDFTRPESFVTAFTIITSVATSEFDYFRRIVLARRKSSEGLDAHEGQRAQGREQSTAEHGGSEQGTDTSQTNSRTFSIQDEMEMLA